MIAGGRRPHRRAAGDAVRLVGFAIEDFSALRYVRDRSWARGLFEELDLVADPDEPRDLYGMILRAGAKP